MKVTSYGKIRKLENDVLEVVKLTMSTFGLIEGQSLDRKLKEIVYSVASSDRSTLQTFQEAWREEKHFFNKFLRIKNWLKRGRSSNFLPKMVSDSP